MLTAAVSVASSLVLHATPGARSSTPQSDGNSASPPPPLAAVEQNGASDSDSVLSDVPDAAASAALPLHITSASTLQGDLLNGDDSGLSDANGDADMESDDADFEDDTPQYPPVAIAREGSSSSHESRRPNKRKAGIEDDEDIMNNPELYGIRRSVRCIPAQQSRPLADPFPGPCPPR
jgi:chromodomain-helicase-DNA-binding protein 1